MRVEDNYLVGDYVEGTHGLGYRGHVPFGRITKVWPRGKDGYHRYNLSFACLKQQIYQRRARRVHPREIRRTARFPAGRKAELFIYGRWVTVTTCMIHSLTHIVSVWVNTPEDPNLLLDVIDSELRGRPWWIKP